MWFLEWLNAIAQDADPGKPGFQAQAMYLLVCVGGPILFGAVVAILLVSIERGFGIKLSSRGGH
jgi:hypothetical protein